ncbi:Transporter OS=Streptomyces alboniger OX=132473 GN=CP975_15325 PE=4 SV=1 [Streptomyces alboniger]
MAPGQAGLAWISIFGGMVAAALVCAPVLALAIWLHAADAASWSWTLLPVGTAYGYGVTELGIRMAAPRVARRLPEILLAVSRG